MRFWIALLLPALLAAPAAAQSFNLDIGNHFGTPPQTFAGAGRAGAWNDVLSGGVLRDVAGNETSVTFEGLTAAGFHDGPATGDVETLLEDGVSLGDAVIRVTLSGLQNGEYEVILYGIGTADPSVRTHFYVGAEEFDAGGAWNGSFEKDITHALLRVQVTTGDLAIDMAGGLAYAGFCSGIQLEYLGPVGVEPASWGNVKATRDAP